MDCTMENCTKKRKAKGLCNTHYMRLLKHGDASVTKVAYHGLRNTPEYNTWVNMKARCYNPKASRYENYGGRRITVCDEWMHSFKQFLADMGKKPSPTHSIDRIDNDKGYSPDNCRWADKKTQVINTRMFKNNTSGIRGVTWNKKWKQWYATIWNDGVHIRLGGFNNLADAEKARKAAELKYWGLKK